MKTKEEEKDLFTDLVDELDFSLCGRNRDRDRDRDRDFDCSERVASGSCGGSPFDNAFDF